MVTPPSPLPPPGSGGGPWPPAQPATAAADWAPHAVASPRPRWPWVVGAGLGAVLLATAAISGIHWAMAPRKGTVQLADPAGNPSGSAGLPAPTITAPAPSTTAPLPVPDGAQLTAMLPDAATVSGILGLPMRPDPAQGGIGRFGNWGAAPPECGGLMPANKPVYDATPARDTDTAVTSMFDDTTHLALYEAVTSFPTARDARDFINAQAQVWPHCRGMAITIGGVSETWPNIEVNHDGDTLNAKMRLAPGTERSQQRLLAVRGLVVIDITVVGIGADQVKTQALAAAVKDPPR